MVEIPGGTFTMGADDGDRNQKPAHRVTVATFCLDATEVTVSVYRRCAGCVPAGGGMVSRYCNADLPDTGDHPVNCVSWDQARIYCETSGKTLPTEAQWEYAARGGAQQRRYPWGSVPPDDKNVCWDHNDHRPPATCPGAGHPEEAFGLRGMGGNVREWVADWYGAYAADALADPAGPPRGTERILRGGAWPMNIPSALVGTFRGRLNPDFRDAIVGFRCAKSRPTSRTFQAAILPWGDALGHRIRCICRG
jgi:formylglycine-generating enzyme required for sulfatase activity